MLHFLVPHLRLRSVCQLSLSRLRSMDVDALLLDVDCTLKRYDHEDVAPEVAAWLDGLRAGGIGLCLVSNGMGRRVRRFAEKLCLPFVANALKPFPLGCRAAVRKMRFRPSRTALVGDQLFADVMAARLAGLTSILVRPIHPEYEPWLTRLKRRPERWLLRRMNVAEESEGDDR
jgi:HAD superfamily phosphatase (TIGR01668 family)